MRSAQHPSERARRCLPMPRRIHPSHNSNSSPNIITRRWFRLRQSVYGMMLRTGVSTPSDFAPERLSSRTMGAAW
jgi:hypothetical protein